MEQTASGTAREQLSLEPRLVARLAAAQESLGQLAMLSRLWPAWPAFLRGPLVARAAVLEARQQGLYPDLVELLGLGPQPQPSRPVKSLRWAVGVTLAYRRLEALEASALLTPSLVGEIFHNLDAPQLARGASGQRLELPEATLPGAAVWTLAPRMLAAGLPALMALGLALASWEREGPDHQLRSPAGRVLLSALARGAGLAPSGFLGLAPALALACQDEPGGLNQVMAEVRHGAAWRRWLGAFLGGVELAAAGVLEAAMTARELHAGHQEVINTWVRAPRHPLALLDLFLVEPVLDLPYVAQRLDVTQRTAGLLAAKLSEQGIIGEVTGQKRGRRFAYTPLIEALVPA